MLLLLLPQLYQAQGNKIYFTIYHIEKTNSYAHLKLIHYLIYSIPAKFCPEPLCDNDPNLCAGVRLCNAAGEPMYASIDDLVVIVFSVELLIRLFLLWAVSKR